MRHLATDTYLDCGVCISAVDCSDFSGRSGLSTTTHKFPKDLASANTAMPRLEKTFHVRRWRRALALKTSGGTDLSRPLEPLGQLIVALMIGGSMAFSL